MPNYLRLSLADVEAELAAIALETRLVFGHLDARQLNWRPDATNWSVAQCFDHLLSTNRQMLQAMDAALDASRARTIWQRLPGLPRLFGALLVKSQAPGGNRKFSAPRQAVPSASAIDAAILDRFLAHQHEAVARLRALPAVETPGAIMVSPFSSVITYSVLDGWRLIVAHERRHLGQARRVTEAAGFPLPLAG